MRKILIILGLFIFSFTNIYAISSKEEKVIDIFIQKIESLAEKKGNFFRIAVKKELKKVINSGKVPVDREKIVKKVINILDENIEKEKIKLEKAEQMRKQEQEAERKRLEEEKKKKQETIKNLGLNYDFEVVKNYWLEKTNKVRRGYGLEEYAYDEKLEKTAQKWSEVQKSRGKWSHERTPGDGFYNYAKINSWFADNGVVCKNVNRVTHSENVGNRSFYCSDGECTDELKKGLDSTFNFYMSEKGTKNDAHYRSIVNKYFGNIGVGVSISEVGKNKYKYYLTVHYCTEVVE